MQFPVLVLTILSFVLPAALPAQRNTGRGAAEAPITVEFVNPEDYTDFGTRYQPSEEDRQALADAFRKELLPVARRYVPEGHHLTLRFLDIDMAGDFEPHRGAAMTDVRIMRPVYAPSLSVEYRVTGPSGDVVSSGRRRITDLTYQNVVTFRRDERLFYETELATQLIREIMRSV